MRNPGLIVALLALLAATGCPPENHQQRFEFQPPREAQQTLATLNRNLEGLSAPMKAPGTISMQFRDDRGKTRSFNGYGATAIFASPRSLYLSVKHPIAGIIARLGANDDRYWLMIDFEDHRNLLWGTWEALEAGQARPLAVPPDRLLETMMFRPLDDRLPGGLPPLLLEEDGRKMLVFQRRKPNGWPYEARLMRLSDEPPYLPVEIIDKTSDGQVVMTAKLSDHRPVAGTAGIYLPHRFQIEWPVEDASLTLKLREIAVWEDGAEAFAFPADWTGPAESLDLGASAMRSDH